jgi:hypothetical protein
MEAKMEQNEWLEKIKKSPRLCPLCFRTNIKEENEITFKCPCGYTKHHKNNEKNLTEAVTREKR